MLHLSNSIICVQCMVFYSFLQLIKLFFGTMGCTLTLYGPMPKCSFIAVQDCKDILHGLKTVRSQHLMYNKNKQGKSTIKK